MNQRFFIYIQFDLISFRVSLLLLFFFFPFTFFFFCSSIRTLWSFDIYGGLFSFLLRTRVLQKKEKLLPRK